MKSRTKVVLPDESTLEPEVQEMLKKIDEGNKNVKTPVVTQSGMGTFDDPSKCQVWWDRVYNQGEESPLLDPESVLNKGLYFEYHLIGGTRGGDPPLAFPLTQKGGQYKWHQDLDQNILDAETWMKKLQIEPIRVQGEVTAGDEQMHYDLLANCYDPLHLVEYESNPLCLIDIKWTETRKDDKWNGWAEAAYNQKATLQATHYVHVFYQATGIMIPFYFLIFGKSGWVKFLRMRIRDPYMAAHVNYIQRFKEQREKRNERGYFPIMDLETCDACPFFGDCEYAVDRPIIEEIILE